MVILTHKAFVKLIHVFFDFVQTFRTNCDYRRAVLKNIHVCDIKIITVISRSFRRDERPSRNDCTKPIRKDAERIGPKGKTGENKGEKVIYRDL